MERQKQLRQAMNAKMILFAGGIFLVFTAVTSTIMYGINFFTIAHEAAKGTSECVEILQDAGISIGLARGVGICFLIVGMWEATVGLWAVRSNNRVDRSLRTFRLILSLLILEVVMQIFLFFIHMMNLGMLFTAIAIPLFLLWGAGRYRKIAKAEPERVYAVETAKTKAQSHAAPEQKKGKSIHERAVMQARLQEEPEDRENEPEGSDVHAAEATEESSEEIEENSGATEKTPKSE